MATKIYLLKTLPKSLVVSTAGTHLYAFGLSHYRFGSVKRSPIYNPYLILIMVLIYFIRQLISMLFMEGMSDRQYIQIGDFAHFLKARYHINLFANSCFTVPLTTQVVHIYHFYKNKDKPSYLAPFEMMSGIRSPLSTGIMKVEHVNSLIRSYNFHMKYTSQLSLTFPLCGIFFSSILLFKANDLFDAFFFSLPWFIFINFCAHHLGISCIYQMVYFKIICRYLILKLKTLNTDIESNTPKKDTIKLMHSLKIKRLLLRLNAIHKEIKSINDNIWCKYLGICIFANIAVANFSFYVYLFVDIPLIVKIAFLYCSVIWLSMLSLILSDALIIYKSVNKSSKLLTNYLTNENLIIQVKDKLQIQTMIEKIAKRNIGFYCINVFILNHLHVYEIIVVTIASFLKLIVLGR